MKRGTILVLVFALPAACSARAPVPSVQQSQHAPPPAPSAVAAHPLTFPQPPAIDPRKLCPPFHPSFCELPPPRAPAPAPAFGRLPDAPPIRGTALLVVSGNNHVCALLDDNSVSCWGNGEHHRVLEDAVDLAAKGDRTCATRTGFVQCWGNLRGQHFEGEPEQGCDGCSCQNAGPRRIAGVSEARAVAVGAEHACALLRTGQVVCWGDNRFGQLGLGHANELPATGLRSEVLGLRDVEEIGASEYATCARRRGGSVFCWGLNAEGQLGARSRGVCSQNGFRCSSTAIQVQGLPMIEALDVAAQHACARTSAGRLFCWGANLNRQLGQLGPDTCMRGRYDSCAPPPRPGFSDGQSGPIPCGLTAREVPLPKPAELTTAGATASCAFFADRSYSCWSGTCRQCRNWLRTQAAVGDGLAGKPWRVQAITGGAPYTTHGTVVFGGGLGAVLFDGGSVQLFSGSSWTPVIDAGPPSGSSPEPLTYVPPGQPRCGRASQPLPACGAMPAGSLDALPDPNVLPDPLKDGKTMRLRARLVESGIDAYSIDSVRRPALADSKGRRIDFELAGGVRFDCNGTCCDFDGLGVKVLATGVIKTEFSRPRIYHRLVRTRLCRMPQ